MSRDDALYALYQASSALERARAATTDTIQHARIRELAVDVLRVIGKLATQKNQERVS
jgi:hypothetical protein